MEREAEVYSLLDGRSYRLNRNGTLAGNSTLMYLLESRTTNLFLSHLFIQAFQGDVVFEWFYDPVIGTPFSALDANDFFSNKNTSSTRVQKSKITTSTNIANVTSFGTQLDKEVVTESATGAQGKFFNSSVSDHHVDALVAGHKYLFKITNNSLTATTFKFHMEISEDEF